MPTSNILTWDPDGQRLFETGCDKGVVWIPGANRTKTAYAWNGLSKVASKPSGADASDFYADNVLYGSLRAAEKYGFSIEAYTYPRAFRVCNGARVSNGIVVGMQNRKPFDFCWRTLVGNDEDGLDHGYVIHFAYNATVSPSEKESPTVGESADVSAFTWEANCIPTPVVDSNGAAILDEFGKAIKPTAYLEIPSNEVDATKLAALEAIIYGSENTASRIPTPGEIIQLFQSNG